MLVQNTFISIFYCVVYIINDLLKKKDQSIVVIFS